MRLLPWRSRSTQLVARGNPARVPAKYDHLKAVGQSLEKEQREQGLLASGHRITYGQANYLRRLIQPWQIRAFGYYDLLGEIKYAAQFYARGLSNLELFAAEIDDDGEINPTEDPEVQDALARIKDPGGSSRKGLQADYGRLMFLTGEALLLCWTNPETEMEQWEMLSTDELRVLDGNITRFAAPSIPALMFTPAPDDLYEDIPDGEAAVYRLWKRHPRFSAIPDAPMEGVLELCEELVLLTHAVRARCRSRLAGSGILFLDDRITTRPQEPTPDEDALEDPFLEDLTEAMTLPITDEGTAAQVVPLLARVKVPDGVKLSDLVYHLKVVDPTELYPETGLRMECVRRIAVCLDMPAEILLGLGDLNHWNVWGIDEQSWKYHLQPIADHFVADLTNAYLGAYLRQNGRDDWAKFVIGYDASKIVNHPDRSKDFFQAHAVGVIGDEALRDVIGATEEDKPTTEELARIIGMKVNDASLAWFGEPSPRAGGVEVAPGQIVQGAPPAPGAPATPEVSGASTEKNPPNGGTPPGQENVVGAAFRATYLAGAASFALLRAREAAGSRIRTLARRDEEALELINGVNARDIAATLGRARVRKIVGGAKEAELVAVSRPHILEVLRQYGFHDETVAHAICETVEKHAVRTLYDAHPPLLPQSFEQYVVGLLRASGLPQDA